MFCPVSDGFFPILTGVAFFKHDFLLYEIHECSDIGPIKLTNSVAIIYMYSGTVRMLSLAVAPTSISLCCM